MSLSPAPSSCPCVSTGQRGVGSGAPCLPVFGSSFAIWIKCRSPGHKAPVVYPFPTPSLPAAAAQRCLPALECGTCLCTPPPPCPPSSCLGLHGAKERLPDCCRSQLPGSLESGVGSTAGLRVTTGLASGFLDGHWGATLGWCCRVSSRSDALPPPQPWNVASPKFHPLSFCFLSKDRERAGMPWSVQGAPRTESGNKGKSLVECLLPISSL